MAVQVLGSGGPIADDGRASAGYLLWVDGRVRLLVDAGGGTFLRFAETGARFEDLEAILLTHLHVDHTAGLPALLKSASFGQRDRPLPVLGPTGDDPFPPLRAFLDALLGREQGAWGYLGGYLEPGGNPFRLEPREVDVTAPKAAAPVWEGGGIEVHAVGVPHGPVPALAYAVRVRGRRIVFAGDQRMDEERFERLAHGADLLVAHHAVPEGAGERARALHATPSRIGAVASRADAGRLVLSHHMARSLSQIDGSRDHIEQRYEGPLHVAEDLDCFSP
ncbi:MAG: MBL fold metallo-hydrolase [Myxococcota bacterium]